MSGKVTTCVIVLNYFDFNITLKCIESLIGQQFDTLYIVDNSGDKAEALLTQSIKDILMSQEVSFKVEVLVNEKNLGFGAGINAAVEKDIEKTEGHSYYLLLNNDAILIPKTIETLVKRCSLNENIALVSPRINWGGELVSFRGYNKYLGHVRSAPNKNAEPYLTGCCLLVDKVLVNSKGHIFDEDFFMYGEDIELNWRAKNMGKEICCADEVTIFHEGTASSKQGEYFYEFHVARGHWLLSEKISTNLFEKILFIQAHFIYFLIRAMVRAWRYQKWDPLVAFWKVIFDFQGVKSEK